jgi:adenosine deaminase
VTAPTAEGELHVHLDGSLRPETMLDLVGDEASTCPFPIPARSPEYMLVPDVARIEGYLERFQLGAAVMQDAKAVERIAYKLAEGHARKNGRYVSSVRL